MPDKLPPLLTAAVAGEILAAIEAGKTNVEVSLDLNLGSETVDLDSRGSNLRGIAVSAEGLRRVLKRPNVAFAVESDGLYPVEVRDQGYAKLVPTSGAPTFELSGVQMHRTSGIDPFEDSRTKVAAVVAGGEAVLDTCGGAGYTALWARRLGAARVVSIEVNPAVRELRRCNPWSREFLEDATVERLEGDAADLIPGFGDGSFDVILHDPPRFSLAGHLYGGEFIAQMRRVLKPGGRLMFYTGEPYRRGRGRDFLGGVERRLRDAGFKAKWRSELQAFVAS